MVSKCASRAVERREGIGRETRTEPRARASRGTASSDGTPRRGRGTREARVGRARLQLWKDVGHKPRHLVRHANGRARRGVRGGRARRCGGARASQAPPHPTSKRAPKPKPTVPSRPPRTRPSPRTVPPRRLCRACLRPRRRRRRAETSRTSASTRRDPPESQQCARSHFFTFFARALKYRFDARRALTGRSSRVSALPGSRRPGVNLRVHRRVRPHKPRPRSPTRALHDIHAKCTVCPPPPYPFLSSRCNPR